MAVASVVRGLRHLEGGVKKAGIRGCSARTASFSSDPQSVGLHRLQRAADKPAARRRRGRVAGKQSRRFDDGHLPRVEPPANWYVVGRQHRMTPPDLDIRPAESAQCRPHRRGGRRRVLAAHLGPALRRNRTEPGVDRPPQDGVDSGARCLLRSVAGEGPGFFSAQVHPPASQRQGPLRDFASHPTSQARRGPRGRSRVLARRCRPWRRSDVRIGSAVINPVQGGPSRRRTTVNSALEAEPRPGRPGAKSK